MLNMGRIIKELLLLCIFSAIALVLGCSSSDNGVGYDVEENLRLAWDELEASNFSQGADIFTEVLDHVKDSTEALVGRGWCYTFLGNYNSAISDFGLVLDNVENADARMGLAAVYRDYPDYQAAISNATIVIEGDSNYVFSRKPAINYKDAHLIKAQCMFRIGKDQFPQAHIEINYLCEIEGLVPLPDPSTLPPAEYEILLSHKLEELTDLIAD